MTFTKKYGINSSSNVASSYLAVTTASLSSSSVSGAISSVANRLKRVSVSSIS